MVPRQCLETNHLAFGKVSSSRKIASVTLGYAESQQGHDANPESGLQARLVVDVFLAAVSSVLKCRVRK